MLDWYNNKYANFSGRATRSEYGFWVLFVFLLFLAVPYFAHFTNNFLVKALLSTKALTFLVFIPINAVTVRRIRDLGFNGGFVFLNFIPYVNFLLVICLLIIKGEDKRNAYGENPGELKFVEE